MILIAHRGNLDGPNPQDENKPSYLLSALAKGYDVEADFWYLEGDGWYLGHDGPQYEIDQDFLFTKGLWLHCKHYEAFSRMVDFPVNFFYHTDEDYVLTGHGFIWAYPGQPGNQKTICVMPELNHQDVSGFHGVCTDYVERYV